MADEYVISVPCYLTLADGTVVDARAEVAASEAGGFTASNFQTLDGEPVVLRPGDSLTFETIDARDGI